VTYRILVGDCRELMPARAPYDMILADPPYGDTSLKWDKRVRGWLPLAYHSLKPTGSMWAFGSMRFFMLTARDFWRSGWRVAQDIVWEKHNGSSSSADRFRRVHEHAVHFYRKCDSWANIYNDPQVTNDATARTLRRKQRPEHWGKIGGASYESNDGGPRLMRSVIYMPSMHGRAIHPTEKPASLIETLIRASCPRGGVVGDFFAGSGSGAEACRRTERRYAGCDVDEAMVNKANSRLDEGLL
jgi:site-specific DNA-methyltransferase (adenine-specific)